MCTFYTVTVKCGIILPPYARTRFNSRALPTTIEGAYRALPDPYIVMGKNKEGVEWKERETELRKWRRRGREEVV